MKDAELNEILKRATVPERGGDYWEQFPGRVMVEMERRNRQAGAEKNAATITVATKARPGGTGRIPSPPLEERARERRPFVTKSLCRNGRVPAAPDASDEWSWATALRALRAKPALALGVATLCLALGFVLSLWKGQRSPAGDPQLATARKYFQEIEALFPNQLQAIVFDEQGTHLVLAREPNLPASPPLYLRICGPKGCQRFVTFSGQQILINGDICDVLTDGRGGVLLVGRQLVWSSDQARAGSGPYRIEAKPLEAAS
jgi:hypothetical protein